MKAIDIRNKFIKYFKDNGHIEVKGSSVIPENNNSVLFTTAGMQQFVPYFLGEKSPYGNKVVDFQKCIRTNDIEEVGDNRHLTFFEMLGNWSFGSYFKEESIKMSFELLTKVLNIPVEKLSVTCFKGDEDVPKDEVSANTWNKCGIPEERIYFLGKDDNWWIAGESGPCGPDTEIFYDIGKEKCCKNCNPSCDCGKYVEIWNNVFMEYFKDEKGVLTKLKQKNVDTGMGLERITTILSGKNNPFELEMFLPVIDLIKELEGKDKKVQGEDLEKRERVIAEHLRTVAILIEAGCRPSNIDRGYILRRLIRIVVRNSMKLNIKDDDFIKIIEKVIQSNKEMYPELLNSKDEIIKTVISERDKFKNTLIRGEKEFEHLLKKVKNRDNNIFLAEDIFMLYERFGLPVEITEELIKESGMKGEFSKVKDLVKKHQEISRKGVDKKFKGGLENHEKRTIEYHTATHLLHKALKVILGDHVEQKGSNINVERLRFDFSHPEKMTKEQIEEVENLVNEKIKEGLVVTCEEMSVEEAKKSGAIGLFGDRYDEKVKVYSIGNFSKEICGGPHVKNTNELGKFKITKEESSSKGIRRIKAILE